MVDYKVVYNLGKRGVSLLRLLFVLLNKEVCKYFKMEWIEKNKNGNLKI